MENPEKPKKKKSRGKTFPQSEIDLLLKLCKKHYSIIENKQTDALSWRNKQKCWETIASEFNSAGVFGMRSATQLHNKWNLLKKTARKEYAEERRNQMGTGGGEFKVPKISENSKKIHELNAETIEGGTNRFDSDSIGDEPLAGSSRDEEPVAGCSSAESIIFDSPAIQEASTFDDDMLDLDLVEGEKENVDWAKFTPASLKRPKHPCLDAGSTPVKRRFTTNSRNVVKTHSDMLKAKLEVAAIQKEYFKKLVAVQEIEEKNKIEQQWNKEEHELKMKILEEELKLIKKKNKLVNLY